MNRTRGNSRAPSVAGSIKSFRSQRSMRSQHSAVQRRTSLSDKFSYQNMQHRNYLQYQGRNFRYQNYYKQPSHYSYQQALARQRVHHAAKFLNTYPLQRQRVYRPYVFINAVRWNRSQQQPNSGYWAQQKTPNYGVYRPYNNNRLWNTQVMQQKMYRARMANNHRFAQDDTESVLSVNITNDLCRKRHPNTIPPLVDTAKPLQSIGRLNRANIAHHNAVTAPQRSNFSSTGSVRTGFSKQSNKKARQWKRARSMNRRPVSTGKGLDPEIQSVIAAIQGKENRNIEIPEEILPPTPYVTAITLHDRFTY